MRLMYRLLIIRTNSAIFFSGIKAVEGCRDQDVSASSLKQLQLRFLRWRSTRSTPSVHFFLLNVWEVKFKGNFQKYGVRNWTWLAISVAPFQTEKLNIFGCFYLNFNFSHPTNQFGFLPKFIYKCQFLSCFQECLVLFISYLLLFINYCYIRNLGEQWSETSVYSKLHICFLQHT